ncbi:hypothetical protein P8625_11305 [Tenacibaculum tangerinum]|uniref:Uncharacterized protein n=1 Tax=Tenacibaculum tangerinum TaxID=3038772 RepID=A0ABY8L3H0_9FLAO|nr:hypothetical protein [Tenacibaculum tangerinum]WGH74670.1 hypothetical protein P8625_11305 [Tenacibaculum tangerinum]
MEYAVDIVSTLSGVGNLLKSGRLVRLLKNGKTLLFKTKQLTTAITATKAAVGFIETSAGKVNILFKLTGIEDTELGKTITKYLFYLEMAYLAGEVSVFLKDKLAKTAKEIVDNPKFTKALDNLVEKGELDEYGKKRINEKINGIA